MCQENEDTIKFSMYTAFGGDVAIIITGDFEVRWKTVGPGEESSARGVTNVAACHSVASISD